MGTLTMTFRPVKRGVGRTAGVSTAFCPPRYGFGRTKVIITIVQAQASRPIELGAALFSNMYSMFMTLFHFLQQSTFVFARSKMLWRLPPIHFGRADSVECTLLRIACQSETFLAPPWQGGIDIRVLWHIGCQSDFDEHFRGTSRIHFKICSPRQKLLTSRQKKSIDTRRNRK